jgi:FtsH-binding integral membrane protein
MFNRNTDEVYSFTRPISAFMHKVYAWMAVGVGISAFVSLLTFAHPEIFFTIIHNRGIFFGLLIAQIVIAFAFSALITCLSFIPAFLMYSLYAGLFGITLSTIFAFYTMSSIATVFGITAGLFACMALYGYFTETDLTSLGSLLIMALIGVIIAGVVNWFLHSSTLSYMLSMFSVLIFTGLTAYDVQKIKQVGQYMNEEGLSENTIALFGAFTLYLDFINLFLALLNLFGTRKR